MRKRIAAVAVLIVGLAAAFLPAGYVAAQKAFVSKWFYSSRCGTQRYHSRFLFTFEHLEASYDEWQIKRRWERANGTDCLEDDWRLLWDLWVDPENGELFGDWPKLNTLVAMQQDIPPIVSFIDRTGADPNRTDRYGRTALHWAYAADKSDAYRGRLIQVLIAAGANPDLKDENGLRPDQWHSED